MTLTEFSIVSLKVTLQFCQSVKGDIPHVTWFRVELGRKVPGASISWGHRCSDIFKTIERMSCSGSTIFRIFLVNFSMNELSDLLYIKVAEAGI